MTTIIEMLKEQYQTGREIKGAIAKIVPDNKKYELIDFNIENSIFTFQEIVAEDSEDLPKTITISEDNALVAHLDENPNEKPNYDAKIIDGDNGHKVLSFGEKQIDMGTISGQRVLAGKNGKIIFTVSTSNEGIVDIWSYDVQYDHFDIVAGSFGQNIKRFSIGEEVYLIDNIISTIEQKDENGNKIIDEDGCVVTKNVLNSMSLYKLVVTKAGKDSSVELVEVNLIDPLPEDDDDNIRYLNLPIEEIRLVTQGSRQDFVVATSKSIDKDGFLVEDDKVTIRLYAYDGGFIGNRVGTFYVSSEKAKIFLGGPMTKPPVVTIKDDKKILINSKIGLSVIDEKTVVEALKEYNYYCGADIKNNDKGQQEVTFYYANDDRSKVKAFVRTDTDRGIMYKLA